MPPKILTFVSRDTRLRWTLDAYACVPKADAAERARLCRKLDEEVLLEDKWVTRHGPIAGGARVLPLVLNTEAADQEADVAAQHTLQDALA